MFNWERRVNNITKDGSDYKQNRSKQWIAWKKKGCWPMIDWSWDNCKALLRLNTAVKPLLVTRILLYSLL